MKTTGEHVKVFVNIYTHKNRIQLKAQMHKD